MNRSLKLLLALTCFHTSGSARAKDLDTKAIEALVDRTLEEWQVPGAAVAIVNAERILFLEGRGVREKGKSEPISPDTIFPLASCSKAFTTTFLAQIADDGKIAWDDPVRKHLKGFYLSDPLADGDVRLYDLVSHRTGVASHDLLWYRVPWSQEEMVRRIAYLPLSKPFRTAMQYQSLMFVAAGQAGEKAGGKPWAEAVQQRILSPLGMKTSSLCTTDVFKVADRSSPHRQNKESVIEVIPWYVMKEPNPAGSVNSSARDLTAWLQLHLNEGMHGETRIVSAANLKMTHTPQIVIPMGESDRQMHPFTQQMSYGMAWTIQDYRGELLVSHAGLIDGFRVHLTMIPKRKLALAILCNLDQTRMNLALSNNLVDLLLDAPPKDWNGHYRGIVEAGRFASKVKAGQLERSRRKGTQPSLPLEKYAGTYEEPAYGTAKVSLEKDELMLEWSSFRCKLEHFHFDTFRARDDLLGQWPIVFRIEEGRRIAAMSAIDMAFKRKE